LKADLKAIYYFTDIVKSGIVFFIILHKEDKGILLKMIFEVCSYNECAINTINIRDSQSSIDFFLFFHSNDTATKANG
jgi:hypothetical protein